MPVPAPQAPFQLQYRPTITTNFVELILTTVNTTFVDVTFTTTASAFVQEPTPACDSSLGESPCGPICCAVGQYCASLGFCAAVGSTTLTAITSTGFATTTVPSQRLTSNVATTVPLSATASTSATAISSPSQTPSPPSSWLHLTASMALEIESVWFQVVDYGQSRRSSAPLRLRWGHSEVSYGSEKSTKGARRCLSGEGKVMVRVYHAVGWY